MEIFRVVQGQCRKMQRSFEVVFEIDEFLRPEVLTVSRHLPVKPGFSVAVGIGRTCPVSMCQNATNFRSGF